MARDKNTYAKRQRETKKRLKAEDKRARRQKRKEEPSVGPASVDAASIDAAVEPDQRLAEVQ